uniref:BED-type domain-containing protein n=1 Tax=Ananas comosus var. bracteatus TaxID=296719 RepID=A0A6V7PMD2_ANACO|nr:unnamed protein product [Ananas comosus var. bracteatus]
MSIFQELLNSFEESSSDSFSAEVSSSESTSIEISSSESISIVTSSAEFDCIEVLSSESQPSIPIANETRLRTKRKRTKPRSEVWQHFDKFYNAEGNLKCKCKYCSREFYCDSRKNGTSSLKNHMGRCKRGPYKEDKTQAPVNLRPDSMGHEGEMMGTAAALRFDQEAIRKGLVCTIALDWPSFSYVESEIFRNFMSIVCPRFVVPSRRDVEMDFYQLYLDERLKLKNFLKTSCQRVSLTIERRSSLQGANYMCLTAHFIDNDWKLNRKILNICPISSEKYKAIGKKVAKCLLDWGIHRVFTITVDSASSSKAVVAYLRKRILNSAGTILGGKFLHGKCIGHICNLIVAGVLKEMADPVARVRGAVKYVLQYPSRLQKFEQYCENEGLQYDGLLHLETDAGWDSTLFMLFVAQISKRAFKVFEVHDPHYTMELESTDGKGTPTDEDWKKVEMLLDFCEFFFITLAGSQPSYVRPYSFFEFILMIPVHFRKWNGKDNIQFKGMVARLEDKYHKYWNKSYKEYLCCTGNMNQLVSVAAVLDPRKKLGKVELELSGCFTTRRLRKKVRKVTYALYSEYEGKKTPQIGKTSDRMHTSGETDHMPEEFRMRTNSQFENGGGQSISELDRLFTVCIRSSGAMFGRAESVRPTLVMPLALADRAKRSW